ncbi:SH3 domain-containing protein [Ruminococcus sp. HUN007]|uniref:SH3 domain-containing protein n=1 Tax=Ruminococcus sp. HUN007 TaxID=1514668 RepID=UPI0005D17BFC|nr:SH3 domain-containing protein [Ruminococcus sp. HUN007]
MKGLFKRGSLRFLSFTAACLVAVASCPVPAGDISVVWAESDIDSFRKWKQFDDRWGDIHLGKSGYNMRGSGCAATSLAFLVAKAGNFKGTGFDPGVFCRLMSQFGGFGPEGDIFWDRVSKVAPGFRYVKTEYLKQNLPYEERFHAIKKYCDEGKLVIIDVLNSGHWVAVDRIENNRIISFDPGGYRNTDVFKQYDHKGNTCIKVFESKYTTQVLPELQYNFDPGKYITTADILNVRKHPDSASERLGGLFSGARVDVKGISGCWGMIIYDEAPAWICLEYALPYSGEDKPAVTLVTEPAGNNDAKETEVTAAPVTTVKVTEKAPVTTTVTTITEPPVTTTVTTITEPPVTTTVTTTTEPPVTTTVTTTTEPPVTTTVTTTTEPPVTTTVTTATEPPLTTTVTTAETVASVFQKIKCKTSDALNFRTGPGTENEIICVLPLGTSVEVFGEDENGRWGMIEYKNRKGWICLDYVVPEDDKQDIPEVSEEPQPVISQPEEHSAAENEEKEEPVKIPPETVLGTAMSGPAVMKPQSEGTGVLKGDVDGNNFINVLDYVILKEHFEGKKTNILYEEADVNSDGSVTLTDLAVMKDMFANRK